MWIDGKQYTNLYCPLSMPDKVVGEPIPNPDNESCFFDAEELFPEGNQKRIRKESEKDQEGIRKESEGNQKGIRKDSLSFHAFSVEKNENRRNISEESLKILPYARTQVANIPYEVMLERWPLVQWLDREHGLEKLEKLKSFPRRLAKKANQKFAPAKARSPKYYRQTVAYYSDYKKAIPVPIWWLRFEYAFEKFFFKFFQD